MDQKKDKIEVDQSWDRNGNKSNKETESLARRAVFLTIVHLTPLNLISLQIKIKRLKGKQPIESL